MENPKKLTVVFYVEYPYYFPHFLPIGEVFEQNGHRVVYVLSEKQNRENMTSIAKKNGIEYTFSDEFIFSEQTDAVLFANPFEKIEKVQGLSVFLEHGIGTKSTSFFPFVKQVDLYLVEGEHKYRYMKQNYPEHASKLAKVGFSKLDPIVNFSEKSKIDLLQKYCLDPEKKTILYAPTFFPSSIERMEDSFPMDFSGYNIIVKPHYLSYERKRYKGQRKKLFHWSRYPNCAVLPLDEYNIVPFLAISDVMISDESSAMFEFAALNKPVVSNQYFKLRWSYFLFPWKLKRRIDSSKNRFRTMFDIALNYQETIRLTKLGLKDPKRKEKERLMFQKEICGDVDGMSSYRIYGEILKRLML